KGRCDDEENRRPRFANQPHKASHRASDEQRRGYDCEQVARVHQIVIPWQASRQIRNSGAKSVAPKRRVNSVPKRRRRGKERMKESAAKPQEIRKRSVAVILPPPKPRC